MKSDYEERKQKRLERAEELASKNDKLSDQLSKQADRMASVIPFGQPILVGHHSERRDRNYRNKIHNAMDKSIEADRKAEYYRGKAESIMNDKSISSDNPDAIDLLLQKIEKLEAQQEIMKAANKIIRNKKFTDVDKVKALVELGFKETTASELLNPDFCGRVGFPDYRTKNNNAVIRNTRQRVEYLTKLAQIPSSEEEIGDARLVVSQEDNRVQVFFPGKPSEEIRTKLKHAGFHWAPSVGAWMRQISRYAIDQARTILTADNAEK